MKYFELVDRYEKVKSLAIRAHSLQTYDGHPYDKHLRDGEKILIQFAYDRYSDIVVSFWMHDLLEDTYISYGMIKKEFGEKIADIVWCVTGNGKTREDQMRDIISKVSKNDDSQIVKVADRIANVSYGKSKGSRQFKRYVKEHEEFKELDNGKFPEMWDKLDVLIYKK